MGSPLSDGYHVLPPGKLASVATWLEMRDRPPAGPPLPSGMSLMRLAVPDPAEYLRLFRGIGERWLWSGRLETGIDALASLLREDGREVYRLDADEAAAGLLELDRRTPGDVEIVYFGLVDSYTGRGIGTAFMAEALRLAWTPATKRVWLHTCTLDHPGALEFYRKCGFRPYQRGVEIVDDPRQRGLLPQEAAPQVPLL